MALITCPECTREISDMADVCPHCGFPVAQHVTQKATASTKTIECLGCKKQTPLDDDLCQHCGLFNSQKYVQLQPELEEPKVSLKINTIQRKPNYKAMGYVFIVAIIIVSVVSYVDSVNNSRAKETENAKIKANFNTIKAKIISNSLLPSENINARATLQSVTSDLTEYKEAQLLLPPILKKIDDANTAHQKEAKETERAQEAKREKERKTEEDARLTLTGKRIHARHPEWEADDCNTIGKRKIRIGMTKEQVAAAWGRPYHINKTHNAYGRSEQWVMHEMGSNYVYFEDGFCTTIQN